MSFRVSSRHHAKRSHPPPRCRIVLPERESEEEMEEDSAEDDNEEDERDCHRRGETSEEEEMEEEEEEEESQEEEGGGGEDSSELDGQDCDRHRAELMGGMAEMERQFSVLREQLYRERISRVESKLVEVKGEGALEYLQPLEELKLNLRSQLEAVELLRQLRLANIACKHEAELVAAEQNLQNEKERLWDSLKDDLEERIQMLDEDRHNAGELSWASRRRRRRNDSDSEGKSKKPTSVSGPFIVYMLEELEILDDWAVIRKAISQQSQRREA